MKLKFAIIAALFVAEVFVGIGTAMLTYSVAVAETVPQMRVRVIDEARQLHPDVWNGCDQACVNARLESAPALVGIAQQTCFTPGGKGALVCMDVADVARFSVVSDFEWGIQFENLFHKAPNAYDWAAHAYPGLDRVRYVLATSPVTFKWCDDDGLRCKLKQEYNGGRE